jgi:glycolate oxidase FAD binding subunit
VLPTVSDPADLAEAARLMREASAAGRRVSIEREGGDVVLSTRRLDRVLEHEAGDLTATVEAGIRLSELERRLGERGQTFQLDPPGDPSLGAAIAGDLFGPRAYRYGRARDLVLGVTLVLADGTVANAGGKVVKNVAGYDLAKLLCGSGGRLALIGRASLRLHPRSREERTLAVAVAGWTDAVRKARALGESQLVPSAVDLVRDRLLVLFEGGARPLARARELVGGTEAEPVAWDAASEAQLAARGRRVLAPHEAAPGDALLVRFGPVSWAFTREPQPAEWSPLAERVRSEFDPAGVLV